MLDPEEDPAVEVLPGDDEEEDIVDVVVVADCVPQIDLEIMLPKSEGY